MSNGKHMPENFYPFTKLLVKRKGNWPHHTRVNDHVLCDHRGSLRTNQEFGSAEVVSTEGQVG